MTFRYAELEDAIVRAVADGVEGKEIGVAFSGGLDSGLASAIAKEHASSVHLYTCGAENTFDVIMAEDLSERLGLPWTHVRIDRETIEETILEMIPAAGTGDPFTISYELPLYCVCREAEEDVILTGQGSDEYFMGCAKFVDKTDEEYEELKRASVDRLVRVSVPCEHRIAGHFGKSLVYPYMDGRVISEISALDQDELRPEDMDSRKSVLRDIASHLGHDCIAARKKKSSQYGSGATDLIRAAAKKKGMMYNRYIASLYTQVVHCGTVEGEPVDARVDPAVKDTAEAILKDIGSSPSEAVELLYRRIVADGGLDVLRTYGYRHRN